MASAIPPADASVAADAGAAAGAAMNRPTTITDTRPSTSSAVRVYCSRPLWRRPATLSSVSPATTPAATPADRPGTAAPRPTSAAT